MAFYDDSNRSKLQREQRSVTYYKPSSMPQWHVTTAELFDDQVRVDIDTKRLTSTLQYVCEKASAAGGGGIPILLEALAITQSEDGKQCVRMTRQEFAIMSCALLPLYLEPTTRNLARPEGFRTVAVHPILVRYVLRKTGDELVDKWRLWAVVRTLAGFVNATTTAPGRLDYTASAHLMNSEHFVVYELVPHVLNSMFRYYGRNVAAYVHALHTTTIIYDVMASYLMPKRLEYINYRLIEEVLNLLELSNMHAFCQHHALMIAEVRKLAAWVRSFDEHSRTRIRVVRDDARCDVNFDLLHFTVFNAACDPRLDCNVAMAMMCSMAVADRRNTSLFAFLDAIPTPCQYNKRVHDLYLRVTGGLPIVYHAAKARELLTDIARGVYDDLLGLNAPPPVYKAPRFPAIKCECTFDEYAALTRPRETTERPTRNAPLEAYYLFVRSFDKGVDAWDLLTDDFIDRSLPLIGGHYLEQAFFHI